MSQVAGTITIGGDVSQLERDIGKILNKNYVLNVRTNSNNNGLESISRDASNFEKSLKAAEARVLAFGATTGIINLVAQSFQKIVTSAIDVEKSLTDINVILNASNSNLSKFGSQLFDIARDTGQSFKEVADTAKEFSRQGLGLEQTLIRTRDALILTRLSGLEVKDSVEAITSAINSFSSSILTSTDVVNKLAAVDQQFAVGSNDLAEAIKRVGSSSEDAGVGLNELLGIVTAVQQTTSRGGAVIGNALKTIFARLGDTEAIAKLKDLGVEIDKSQNGLQKLQAISNAIKVNPDYANEIKKIAGGVFQINVVSAALQDLGKNYGIAAQATKLASEATDEAVERNKRLNVTLAALTNESLQNITQLSAKLGQDLFAPTIRSLATSFNSISTLIKDANNDQDKLSIKGGSETLKDFGFQAGQGFIKGLGEYIAGPGIALAGAALGKLFYNFSVFAKNSIAGLFNINSVAGNQEKITESVNQVLSQQPEILRRVLAGTTSIIEAEKEVLAILRLQIAEREKQTALAGTISRNLTSSVSSGFVVNSKAPSGFSFKGASQGFIPERDQIAEKMGAAAGGYTATQIKQMDIPGVGRVIYNGSEKVVDFGLAQPAILPPENTKAGAKYKNDFTKTHGFNPYVFAAQGIVPSKASKVAGFNSSMFAAQGLVPSKASKIDLSFDTKSYSAPVSVEEELEKQTEVLKALDAFKNSIRKGQVAQDSVNKFISDLSKNYDLSTESIKKLNTSINSTISYQKRIEAEAAKPVLKTSSEIALGKTNNSLGIQEYLQKAQLDRVNSPAFVNNNLQAFNKIFTAPLESQQKENRRGIDFTNLQSQIQKNQSSTRVGVETAIYEGRFNREPGNNRISQIEAEGRIERDAIYAQGDKYIKNLKAIELEKKNALADAQNGGRNVSDIIQSNYDAPSLRYDPAKEALRRNLFGLDLRTQSYLKNQQAGIQDSNGVFGGFSSNILQKADGADATKAIALRDLNEIAKSNFRTQPVSGLTRFGERVGGLQSAFIGAAAEGGAGALKEIIGNDTVTKRNTNSILDVASKTLSYGSSGALLGSIAGPQGAAVGAVAGAAIGLGTSVTTAIKNWNSVLPDLEKRLNSLSESSALAADGISKYIDIGEKLRGIFSGEVTASPTQLGRLREDREKALNSAQLNDEQRAKIKGAGNNISEINEILNQAVVDRNRQKGLVQASITTKEFSQKYGDFVDGNRFLGRQDSLNVTGKAKFDELFTSVLDSKNSKGEPFSNVFKNEDFIKTLDDKKGKGGDFFSIIKSQAEKGGFGDVTSILEDLSKTSNSQKTDAFSRRGFELAKDIPKNAALGKELEGITKQNIVKNQFVDNSLQEEISRFQKYISDANVSFAEETGNQKISATINKAERSQASQILEPVSTDVEKILSELADSIKNLDDESKSASLEIRNNLIKQIGELALSSSQDIANKSINKINQDKNINLTDKTRIAGEISLITREFREQLFNVKDSSGAKGIADQNRERVNVINKALENPELGGEGRASLQTELEVRKQFIQKLSTLGQEYDIALSEAGKTRQLGEILAQITSNTKKTLSDFNQAIAINGNLSSFKSSTTTGKDLFDFRSQIKIGQSAGDIQEQIQGLVGVGKTFESQGFNVPSDIKKQLIDSVTKDVSEQVKSGNLSLPTGETPETIAQKKVSSTFKDNGVTGNIRETPFIITNQTQELRSELQLFNSVSEQVNSINSAEQKRLVTQSLINNGVKDGIKAQREYTLEIKNQIAAQAEVAFAQGRITGDQLRQAKANARNAEKDANGGRLSNSGIRDAFFDQFKYNTRDLYDELEQGAAEVGQSLKSGFKDAFKSFADGTKSAEGALADFGIGILKKLGDKAFDVAVNSIFGVAFSSLGSAFGGKANGGPIKGFSVGGPVTGGSGTKDDVPALLSDGEYVIKKSAVQRYGIDFLDSVNKSVAIYDGQKTAIKPDDSNNEALNAVFANAFTYNNPARPTSGAFKLDDKLSIAALEDDNNPQNKIRSTREEALGSYLREAKSYEKYKEEQLSAFKKQQRRALQAAYIQAGISAVGLGISAYAGSLSKGVGAATTSVAGATGNTVVSQPISAGVGYSNPTVTGGTQIFKTADLNQFQSNPQAFGFSSAQNFSYSYGAGYKRAMGGPIQKFANGGSPKLFGGDSSSDRIPALLMDGEYVVKKKSVDKYGKSFFDKLNESQIRKLSTGGFVTDSSSQGIGSGGQDFSTTLLDLTKATTQLKEAISQFSDKGTSASIKDASGSGGVVNNINVNVTIDKGGKDSTESTSSSSNNSRASNNRSSQEKREEQDKSKAFAEKIKNLVTQTIIEEKRPGGLLHE